MSNLDYILETFGKLVAATAATLLVGSFCAILVSAAAIAIQHAFGV